MGKKLRTAYYQGSNYTEVDVDISCSKVWLASSVKPLLFVEVWSGCVLASTLVQDC